MPRRGEVDVRGVSVRDERRYQKRLLRIIAVPLHAAVRKAVAQAPPTRSGVELALTNVQLNMQPILEQAERAARTQFNTVAALQWRQFSTAIRRPLRIQLLPPPRDPFAVPEILMQTIEDNVGLIRTIPQRYHEALERDLYRLTTSGKDITKEEISRIVQQGGRAMRSNVDLIGRDQTQKMYSAVNQVRQEQLGVTRYVWRTHADDRVRETHEASEGLIFRWDTPPYPTGHPGNDIQCRCVAQPLIDGHAADRIRQEAAQANLPGARGQFADRPRADQPGPVSPAGRRQFFGRA